MLSKAKIFLRTQSSTVLCVAVFLVVIRLYLNDKITLYIHPRYALFTFILSLVGTVVLGLYLLVRRKRDVHAHHSEVSLVAGVLMVVYAVAVVLVPPATLSSSVAQNRNTDISTRLPDRTVSLAQSSSLKFEDWAWLAAQSGASKTLDGRRATFEGFVMQKAGEPSRLLISRFTITCCAIDATPITIEVEYKGWDAIVSENQWVRVEGVFDGSAEIPFLRASSIVVIPEPEVPYAF